MSWPVKLLFDSFVSRLFYNFILLMHIKYVVYCGYEASPATRVIALKFDGMSGDYMLVIFLVFRRIAKQFWLTD